MEHREIKYRYTFRRKTDGKLYQAVWSIESIETGFEGFNDMLKNNLWERIARDEYIGMQDKNKNDIFEGDILKSGNGKLWIVKWMHQSWYVSNHQIIKKGLNKFAGDEMYTFHDYFKMLVKSKTNIIIIGTIHDNPELLQSL